jgi:transcription antitermination protein NusB
MPLTRHDQRLRRRARARVLQALYVWDLTPRVPLGVVADRLWADLNVGSDERRLAAPAIETIARRHDEIDALLADATTNWRLERLGAVERAVLRLGVAELLLGGAPPRVVIQEGVRLAERFGSEESARFVNGVLDAMARHLGSL